MPTNVLVLNKNSWVVTGVDNPEGKEAAPVGSIYLREDGTAGTSLYVKETGMGNTGWKALGTVTPTAHATTHQDGGADELALDAAQLTTGTLPFARMPSLSPSRLIGRNSAASGPAEVIVLGSGLSMSGAGILTATGNVTGPGSAVVDRVASYSDTTGKVIKDSGILVTNLAKKDVQNTFTATQEFTDQVTFRSAYPVFNFVETDAPTDAKNWQFTVNGQWFQLHALNDAWGTIVSPLQINRSGRVYVAEGLVERGRPVAMGEWTDVPFDPANFASISGGIYTVTEAPTVNHYTLIGKTLLWNVIVQGTMTGTAVPHVILLIPAGLTGRLGADGFVRPHCSDYSGGVTAIAQVWYSGAPYILVQKVGGDWSGAAYINLCIQFEIL